MKKLGVLLISLGVIACQSEKKTSDQTDSTTLVPTEETTAPASNALSFKYDSLVVHSKTSVVYEKSQRDTTKAVIFYPVFTDAKINEAIRHNILASATDPDHKPASLKEMVKEFVDSYDSFRAEEKDYKQTWFMDSKTEVVAQQKDYLSTLHTYVSYEGGAHPNSYSGYWNYNPQTHQEIKLADLIKPNTRKQLVAIAEKIFRKNEKLTPTASLKDNYFFENGKFDLNDNFTITKEGLKFLYNPYEIKAYAYGITVLIIPFSDLKDIAQPNSLLTTSN